MPFFSSIENMMLALGLTLPRIVGAFVMLPLISPQNMPAMVRNSFLVSLAIVALPIVVTTAPPGTMSTLSWPALVVKELSARQKTARRDGTETSGIVKAMKEITAILKDVAAVTKTVNEQGAEAEGGECGVVLLPKVEDV